MLGICRILLGNQLTGSRLAVGRRLLGGRRIHVFFQLEGAGLEAALSRVNDREEYLVLDFCLQTFVLLSIGEGRVLSSGNCRLFERGWN